MKKEWVVPALEIFSVEGGFKASKNESTGYSS